MGMKKSPGGAEEILDQYWINIGISGSIGSIGIFESILDQYWNIAFREW